MAVADTINSMKQHIQDAYGMVQEKGGTIPSNKNLENLSDSISSISGGGDIPTIGFVINKWNVNGFAEEITTYGYTSLSQYDLGSGNNQAHYYLFAKELKKVNLNPECTTLNNRSFYYTTIKEIDCPGTTFIGATGTFTSDNILKVALPNLSSSGSISTSASPFNNSTKLRYVWLGDKVTNNIMRPFLFKGCTGMEKLYVDLPRATVETFSGYFASFSNNAFTQDKIICNDDAEFITYEEFKQLEV